MGLLVSSGFLGAKAGHSDQRFCRWKLLFYQQPCAKAKEFGFRRILGLFAGFFMEESCFGFGKAKETALLKKQAKFKGEGKPTLSMRRFPLSLFIYPKLCSFGLLLKMRCIFFTEQSYTDQGSTPGPPYAVPSLFEVLHRPGEHPWTPVRRAFLI